MAVGAAREPARGAARPGDPAPPSGESSDPADPTTGTGAAAAAAAAAATAPAAFVDSSALVALVDGDDASHAAVVAAYRDLVADGYKLFTTDLIVVETFDLLRAGPGVAVARRWLRDSRLAVYHADEQDLVRARRLVLAASEERDLSLTDAVSLVVMERLGVADAFAVDQRFLAEAG